MNGELGVLGSRCSKLHPCCLPRRLVHADLDVVFGANPGVKLTETHQEEGS